MIRSDRRYARLSRLGALFLVALLQPVFADANSTIASGWTSKYSASASYNNAGCALCHEKSDTSGTRWNSYGRALKQALQSNLLNSALTNIESIDSDGDSGGASNKTEIDAGTQPGWRAGSGNSIFDSTLAAVGPTVSPPATISGNVDPVPPPALPTLSIGDVTGTEGNSGTTPFVFTVSLSAPTSATVTVSFATANGSATAGVDYVSTSSQLTFSPNETSKTISVLVIGNTTFESDKTFTVNLSGPTHATIADGQGIGRIVNDDLAPTAATLSIGDISAPEGNSGTTAFVFTVTLAPASTSTVTVDYATASGTAAEGVDFVPAFGTLTLPPGAPGGLITVLVNGNTTVEANRTFSVQLSNAVNATIADGQGIATIIDDDGPPLEGPTNFQGLWWNSPAGSESGWGINFAHQADVIFASWFTYDLNGRGWWLVMSAFQGGPNQFSGDIIEARGPPFNTVPFPPLNTPGGATGAFVGSGLLTFSDENNGTFAYTVNGISQTKNITRQILGAAAPPVCIFNSVVGAAAATNYQDIWWAAPAQSEDGWGINLTHQGSTIFGTWFTYDSDRAPMWLVVTALQTSSTIYAGDLYRTTGPPFNAVPFPPIGSPGGPTVTKVGTATFAFGNGQTGTFAYTVNGVSQAKAITRQVFRPPGTVCQ